MRTKTTIAAAGLLLVMLPAIPAWGQAAQELNWEYDAWERQYELEVDAEDYPRWRHLANRYPGSEWEYETFGDNYKLEVPADRWDNTAGVADRPRYDRSRMSDDRDYDAYGFDGDDDRASNQISNVTMNRIYQFADFNGRVIDARWDGLENEWDVKVAGPEAGGPPIVFRTHRPLSVKGDWWEGGWRYDFDASSPFHKVEVEYDEFDDAWEYEFTSARTEGAYTDETAPQPVSQPRRQPQASQDQWRREHVQRLGGMDVDRRADAMAPVTVQGTLSDVRGVQLVGIADRHQLATLQTRDGRSIVVDLGAGRELREINLREGEEVIVQGTYGRMDGDPVLFADMVAEVVRIDRRNEQQRE